MESYVIVGLFLLGFLIGGVVSRPCRMYLITSYERKGHKIIKEEKIFLKKKSAIKEYQHMRLEAITEYAKEYPNDYAIPEDTYFLSNAGTQLYDGDGKISVTAKIKLTAPYLDYDTKEKEIELQHKSLS